MKYLSHLAGAAFLAVLVSLLQSPATAADLGGNCCADLEERIAELEATTARKGGRKVSLMVYGQVNKAIAIDVDSGDSRVIDNTSDETRVGFAGEAHIGNAAKAGFLLELHTNFVNEEGFDFPDPTASGNINVRRSAVWVGVDRFRVTLGRYDTATHELIDMTTANTTVAVKPLNVFGITPQTGITDEVRADVDVSDHFRLSASWTPSYFGGNDLFSAAARYTDKAGDLKYLAGIGYDSLDGDGLLSGVASVMHVPTGVFFAISGVRPDHESISWHLTGGLERKFVEWGATTLFAEYGDWKAINDAFEGKGWGVGIVQHIDAAAMDAYVSYRDYDGNGLALVGARVNF